MGLFLLENRKFDKYGKEKVILSRKMAAFLVLNGCKLNHTRTDLKNKNRYVFFFKEDEFLYKMMEKFPEYSDSIKQAEVVL